MTLADRVVVMNKGVMQQVGTPTEIYDRPANAFVASFIGSPAMNLVDGEISNGTFTADRITVSGLNPKASGKVTLGFRAEDASISQAQAQINAPVYSLELLGDATMVTARVAGGTLVSIKAGKDYRTEIGNSFSATVTADICHLFDTATGARID